MVETKKYMLENHLLGRWIFDFTKERLKDLLANRDDFLNTRWSINFKAQNQIGTRDRSDERQYQGKYQVAKKIPKEFEVHPTKEISTESEAYPT